jgi:predicted ATPase
MYPDGVLFVPLAPIDDPMLVPSTIARTLGLGDLGGRPALDVVVENIGEKRLLLVIDNFEQVLSAAAVIAELLRRTPNTTVLLTSRAVLHVSGEQEYEVPGLPAPPDVDHLSTSDAARLPRSLRRYEPGSVGRFEAVRLFVARARAVQPGFQLDDANAGSVARITARLAGMPLPIELVAARVKLHAPDAILKRLDDQLGLLASSARDVPERQRTIRGAIDWSVELLVPSERTLLGRLGVFVGGFDLTSVVTVCGGDGLGEIAIEDALTSLVDQSLVRRVPEAAGRTELLEPIREFAVEQLRAAGELDARRDRHALHFLALAEDARPNLAGDEQGRWLDGLELERDNLRAAVGWAIQRPLPAEAMRLASALWRFWQKRGYLDEGAAWLTTILDAEWSRNDLALRARALEALGGVRYWQGRIPETRDPYSEATVIWRSLGDRRELANALYNESYVAGMDEPEVARSLLEEARSIYTELDDDVGLGNVLWATGTRLIQTGDGPGSERLFRESRDRFSRVKDRTMEAWADHMLGAALVLQGRYEEADEAFVSEVRQFDQVGDVSGIAIAVADLSLVERHRGNLERAVRLWLAGRSLARATGMNLLEESLTSFPGIWVEARPEELPPGMFEKVERDVEGWSLDDTLAYARGSRDTGSEPRPMVD